MLNDKQIKISVGAARYAEAWLPQQMLWSEFVARLAHTVRSGETLSEYKLLPKVKQDDLKDVGGFVGGTLINNRRGNNTLDLRYLVTLDMDNIAAGNTQQILNAVSALGCAYVIYSTRKHEPQAPRLRVICPLDRPVTADEYQPIARKLASFIGIDCCDPTTFEPARLMYWPSSSSDGEYVYCYEDKPWLSADGMLSLYANWQDCSEWDFPQSATKAHTSLVKKQADPLTKPGVVGAFCRTYSIEQAIALYLPDVYTPHSDGRYTYTKGSTVGGAVLYDDKFLYSHHGTDPCGGKLCNAFDLVRFHLFWEQDYDAKPDTPAPQMPSYKLMQELAVQDSNVVSLLQQERYENATSDFAEPVVVKPPENILSPLPTNNAIAPVDTNWLKKLKIHSQTAMPLKTSDNILIILNNDPLLKGKIAFDEFAKRPVCIGATPWRGQEKNSIARSWTDTDDAGLRHYIEKTYGITGKDKISDAFILCAESHKYHQIKDYLLSLTWDGVNRLDNLFVDYLGAMSTEYVRAVTRKSFVAAVARILSPGVKYDTMPVISGKQGIGKSTLLKKMGKDWHNDSISAFKGKEAPEQIQGYWIIELGELAGFNRSESNDVKQFLSRTEDVYREPYGKRTVENKRQCVFFGTTNDSEYLKDATGNRRFLPIDTGIVAPTKSVFRDLDVEVDQLWAEALARWYAHEPLFLSDEVNEVAVKEQDTHKVSDPREGLVREFVSRKLPSDWGARDLAKRRLYWSGEFDRKEGVVARNRVCAIEIWCECFNQDAVKLPRAEAVAINNMLTAVCSNWVREPNNSRHSIYGQQKGFHYVDTPTT